ncbi:PEGA domain-containing protein [Bacteroidota bacterium]
MAKGLKVYLSLLFIFLPMYLSAQATQFIIESFQIDLNDLEANRNPVYDANDNKCALIKVRTDLGGITFSSNNGIVDQKKVLTEYWIYVSSDEKRLNVYKDGFLPLNFDMPLSLEESKVYTFYITTSKRYSIIIQTDPKNAIVKLDNNVVSAPNISNVNPGTHTLRIELDGYMPIEDTITVEEGNIFFNYSMDKMEPVVATFNSNPSGATIIINNEYKGQTPKQLFLYPGKNQLHLDKEFYSSIKEEITISKDLPNDFNYELQINTAHIGVYTFPGNAEVFLNGNKIIERTKIEGGEHIVEVKLNKYYDEKKVVYVRGGADTVLTISLRPILGNLQFTVNPVDADVELYKEEELFSEWTGAKRIEDMQIGSYKLIVDAKRYKKIEQEFEIKENTTEDIYIDLTGGKQIERQKVDAGKQTAKKGKMPSVALSMAFPGLGQFYSGHKARGYIYSIAGLGAAAATVYFNSEFSEMNNNYKNSVTDYDNAVSLADISDYRTKMDNNYNDLKAINKNRQICFLSFASIYGINLIDALIFGEKREKILIGKKLNDKNIYFQTTPVYGGLGIQLTYKF